MRYIIYLSGDNIPLAKEELKSVISKQDSKIEIIHDLSRLIILDTDKKIDFSDCALLTEASKYLSAIDSTQSIDFSKYKNMPINVRVIKHNPPENLDSMQIERKIGHLFIENGAKIDLDHPEKKIRIYISKDTKIIGEQVFSNLKQYKDRKASLRPFHMPISLDPKIARTMVNLAQAKTGDRILDPFAGTGGILIEAGLINCKAFGIDIDKKMVEGTIENLKHYNISNHIVKEGDAFDSRAMFGDIFDAIITDLPYGKNTKDTDIRNLAENFLEYAAVLIKPGKRIVIASNIEDLKIPKNLEKENLFEIYIHKSMSKWIYVLKTIT